MQTEINHVQALPPSLETEDKEAFIQFALQEPLAREELLCKQKSRVDWLTMPDLNTRLFHLSTIIRRNSIDYLKAEDGRWLDNGQDIGDHIYDSFKSLFQSSHPVFDSNLAELIPRAITEEDNERLCSYPSKEEIFAAVKSIGASKAPVPDGITALFYQKFWAIVKKYCPAFLLTRVIC